MFNNLIWILTIYRKWPKANMCRKFEKVAVPSEFSGIFQTLTFYRNAIRIYTLRQQILSQHSTEEAQKPWII